MCWGVLQFTRTPNSVELKDLVLPQGSAPPKCRLEGPLKGCRTGKSHEKRENDRDSNSRMLTLIALINHSVLPEYSLRFKKSKLGIKKNTLKKVVEELGRKLIKNND